MAFIQARESMVGTDPDIITQSEGEQLTMTDLRALVSVRPVAAVGYAWRAPYSRLCDLGQDVMPFAPAIAEEMAEQMRLLRIALASPGEARRRSRD